MTRMVTEMLWEFIDVCIISAVSHRCFKNAMLFKMHHVLISLAPPGVSDGSGSPAGVVFMLGSPEYGHTPPHATRPRRFSGDTSIILLYEIETQVFASYCICYTHNASSIHHICC